MSESITTGITSQLADGTAAGSWVLDPAQSRAEFRVKHFWGVITVRGTLERMTGEATVSPDGTVTGRISFDASSLSTKNKQRDKHLRSADFFHADKHPQAVLTVTSARAAGPDELECQGPSRRPVMSGRSPSPRTSRRRPRRPRSSPPNSSSTAPSST